MDNGPGPPRGARNQTVPQEPFLFTRWRELPLKPLEGLREINVPHTAVLNLVPKRPEIVSIFGPVAAISSTVQGRVDWSVGVPHNNLPLGLE